MNTNEMDIWDCAEECSFDDFVKKYDKKYLNKQNDYGYTLLHEALSGRHVETVMFLIKEGADVNLKDNRGNTVLYYLTKESMCPPVLMMLTASVTEPPPLLRRSKTRLLAPCFLKSMKARRTSLADCSVKELKLM